MSYNNVLRINVYSILPVLIGLTLITSSEPSLKPKGKKKFQLSSLINSIVALGNIERIPAIQLCFRRNYHYRKREPVLHTHLNNS